jgi:pilus assembly protein CpaF
VDDDRTPPPTRNPFASSSDDGLGAPADEPNVQIAADLLADDDETQGRGVAPPRPALRPNLPPQQRPPGPTAQRPGVPAPVRRPAPPPARPAPPVPDDDEPPELDNSEKTHIKPIPEKPRR